MNKSIIRVGLAALCLVGSFLPLATGGNYTVSINHIGGLAWLLYPLALTALVLAVTAVYKPDIRYLRLWIGTVALAGLALTALSVSSGITHLEYLANSSRSFSFLRDRDEVVEKVVATIASGGAMAISGYLITLLLTLVPVSARSDRREVEQ